MPKTKPRRSRKDYLNSREIHSTASTTAVPQSVPVPGQHYVHPQLLIPSQSYAIPSTVSSISNGSVNNVTMTLQEYHALMRHSRTQQLRCIYFPDCCQRIQPMNAWCAFCISQHMFPGFNGVYPAISPCNSSVPVCSVPSICSSPCNTYCPTSTYKCPIQSAHQSFPRPNDTCPFPETKQ